jgi:murein DD-endopeptidase MepM/ murein hydrolase activator NlpD
VSAERIAETPALAVEPREAGQTIDKAQVARLAAEFESLLLSNIFRDMRSAGRWSDEDSSDTLGAGAFGQTFDTELARTLSQAGGFGLKGFLQNALDRYAGEATAGASATSGSVPSVAPAVVPTTLVRPAQCAVSAIPAPAGTSDTTDAASLSGIEGARSLTTGEGRAARPADLAGGQASRPAAQELQPAGQGLQRPSAALTSAFGWRRDPVTGRSKFHRGIDLKAAEGDPVSATGGGRVVFSGRNGGYGNSVVIEHANGVQTRYAHLSTALVNAGDEVSEGQPIGLAGHTGRATGPHVHYEVLAQGRAVDPLR